MNAVKHDMSEDDHTNVKKHVTNMIHHIKAKTR